MNTRVAGDVDLDLDERIDLYEAPGVCRADINGNGVVNGGDIAFILGHWSACSL